MDDVTCVVLNYNYGRFLLECLRSIENQSYNDLSILLIDDNSTDESLGVIDLWLETTDIKARVIRKPSNCGVAHSYNIARNLVTSKFITFVDSDDRLLPDKTQRQVDAFTDAKNVVAVYSDVLRFGEDFESVRERPREQRLPTMTEDILAYGSAFSLHSALIRTSSLKEISPFDERLRLCDLDMWLKLSRVGDFLYVPILAGEYRQHRASMSRGSLVGDRLAIIGRNCRGKQERRAGRQRGWLLLKTMTVGLKERPRFSSAFAYSRGCRDPRALPLWLLSLIPLTGRLARWRLRARGVLDVEGQQAS